MSTKNKDKVKGVAEKKMSSEETYHEQKLDIVKAIFQWKDMVRNARKSTKKARKLWWKYGTIERAEYDNELGLQKLSDFCGNLSNTKGFSYTEKAALAKMAINYCGTYRRLSKRLSRVKKRCFPDANDGRNGFRKKAIKELRAELGCVTGGKLQCSYTKFMKEYSTLKNKGKGKGSGMGPSCKALETGNETGQVDVLVTEE